MGGRLGIHLATAPGDADAAGRDARRVAGRVRAWAGQITRHDPASPLMRLNGDARVRVPVSPTLGAALSWAADAATMTDGLVDVTRLDERLAAESGSARRVRAASGPDESSTRAWRVERANPRRAAVTRPRGMRFDLDGVGKGWLADRALRLLERHPGAVVDADGDVALRIAPGDRWEIGVADPRGPDDLLAVIVLADEPGAPARGRRTWGVATSGTTIHRFGADSHHLIDPRTGLPASTDVVQATVLASAGGRRRGVRQERGHPGVGGRPRLPRPIGCRRRHPAPGGWTGPRHPPHVGLPGMTYQGLDPRTRRIRWGLFAIAIVALLAITLPTAIDALLRVAQVAPDRLPWVATRLIGFLSYFAIAGSVIYGLLLSTKILDAIAHRPVSFALHQDLAAIGLGLAGVHAVLLGLDASVPFSLFQVVVPFAAPYRPLWVGLGPGRALPRRDRVRQLHRPAPDRPAERGAWSTTSRSWPSWVRRPTASCRARTAARPGPGGATCSRASRSSS